MSTFTKLSPSNTVLYKHTASSLQDNWLQVPGRYSPLSLEPGFYTPYLQDLQLRFMDLRETLNHSFQPSKLLQATDTTSVSSANTRGLRTY